METCAEKLIHTFLELKHRTMLTGITWTGHSGKVTSIGIVYKQFMALSACMGLELKGDTPEKIVACFDEGEFIKKRPLEKYEAVLCTLEEYEPMLKNYSPWTGNSFRYKYWQLEGLFKNLMLFKLKTDFRYYGPLEGLLPGIGYAHFLRTNALDKTIVGKIDGVLAQIIDPNQTPADMNRLMNEFDYPKEDYESVYRHERINEIG